MSDTLNSTDAREQLADVLNRVAYAGDRVRITRRGKVVAAVVPIADLGCANQHAGKVMSRDTRNVDVVLCYQALGH